MPRYQFIQRCHPGGDLRTRDVAEFMKLMQQAFGVPHWIGVGDTRVDLTPEFLEEMARSRSSDAEIAQFGAQWVVKAGEGGSPVLLMISTGGDEWALNDFTANFSHSPEMPDLQYFRSSIKLIKPYEGYILENKNDNDLRERRGGPKPQKHGDLRPRGLHWFHYISEEVADQIGGMSHCLRTPAFKVEPFCDGVLFQLTPEPLDPGNPQHLEAQRRAMEHLGIE